MFKTKLKTRKSGGDNWRKDDGTSLIAKFRLYDEVAPQDRDRVRSRINDLTHPGHTNYLVEYADFVNSPAYTNRFNHELLDIKLVLDACNRIGFEGIDIIIQYVATYNKDKVKELAINYAETNKETLIQYNGMVGKIKVVKDEEPAGEENTRYGFFKKGAKSRYYPLSTKSLFAMSIIA